MKKLLALLIAVAILLTLTACEEPAPEYPQDTDMTTTEDTTTPEPDTTEETADTPTPTDTTGEATPEATGEGTPTPPVATQAQAPVTASPPGRQVPVATQAPPPATQAPIAYDKPCCVCDILSCLGCHPNCSETGDECPPPCPSICVDCNRPVCFRMGAAG